MKKGVIVGAAKALLIVALLGSAGYVAFGVPQAINSFMPQIETMYAEKTNYLPAVSARGSIVRQEGKWLAVVAVGEADISEIKIGQTATLSGAAFGIGAFSGEVVAVSDSAYTVGTIASAETMVDVTIAISASDKEELRAGYSVEAEIAVGEQQSVYMLPYSVIGQDDNGEYVYVYQDGVALRRSVTTGVELYNKTEIVAGIDSNDKVITNPKSVVDGGRVRLDSAN